MKKTEMRTLEGKRIPLSELHKLDSIKEIVYELEKRGFEYNGLSVVDTGPGKSSQCEYCGAALRYEFHMIFYREKDDRRYTFMVGSTCIKHFKEYVGSYDAKEIMKKYKKYRDLYMDLNGIGKGRENEVPPIPPEDLEDEIERLKDELAKESLEVVKQFTLRKQNCNDFYQNVHEAIEQGTATSDQINAVLSDIKDKSELYVLVGIFETILRKDEEDGVIPSTNGRSSSEWKEFLESISEYYHENGYLSDKQKEWGEKIVDMCKPHLARAVNIADEIQCPQCGAGCADFDEFLVCSNAHITRQTHCVGLNCIV